MKNITNCLAMFFLLVVPARLFGDVTTAASQDTLPSYRMSEIVVVAEKASARPLTPFLEIDRAALREREIHDASEALMTVPGIHFSRTAKNEETFYLRGFGQRQISVFLDGVPISIPFDGVVDLSQLVGDDIWRLRVSGGISSVLYGANTLGGTVNIITTPPQSGERLRLRLEGSGQGRLFGGLGYAGHIGKLIYSSYLALDQAPNFQLPADAPPMANENGGRRDNSEYRKSSASLKFFYPFGKRHRLALHMNVVDNRFNVPPNALSARPRYWRFPEWKRSILSLSSDHFFGPRFMLRTAWYYDQYRNVLESYDDPGYTTQTRRYAFSSTYDDYSLGVNLYPRWYLLPFGATDGILSVKQDVHRQKSGEAPFENYAARTWIAGFQQTFRLTSRWSALIGADANYLRPVRAQDFPLRDPILLMNGQAVVQFTPNSRWRLHVATGRKSRFPTLKELYSERLGRYLANPELKAERSFNNEAGIDWKSPKGSLRVTLFYNRLTDLIAPRQLGNNLQQMQNIGEALLYGFDTGWRQRWHRLELTVSYTFLKAQNRSPDRDADYLEYRPRHTLYSELRYRINRRFTVGMEARYVAGQYFQNPDTGDWRELNDYLLFHLRVGYRLTDLSAIYLCVSNLTDQFYYSEYGVPMPGRDVMAGLRVTL